MKFSCSGSDVGIWNRVCPANTPVKNQFGSGIKMPPNAKYAATCSRAAMAIESSAAYYKFSRNTTACNVRVRYNTGSINVAFASRCLRRALVPIRIRVRRRVC